MDPVVLQPLLTLSGQVYANPEVSFDFSQSTGTVPVASTDTIIRTVSAACRTNPDAGNLAGHLVATANTEFDVFGNTDGVIFITCWLSRNSVGQDGNHSYEIFLSEPTTTAFLPSAAIQRIDSCNEGQTVTYNFMARNDSIDSVEAFKPRLVVRTKSKSGLRQELMPVWVILGWMPMAIPFSSHYLRGSL